MIRAKIRQQPMIHRHHNNIPAMTQPVAIIQVAVHRSVVVSPAMNIKKHCPLLPIAQPVPRSDVSRLPGVRHGRDTPHQPCLHRLIEEALAAGYGALVVTVDFPVSGIRERDLRSGYTVNEVVPADGLIARKDVYTTAHAARVLS